MNGWFIRLIMSYTSFTVHLPKKEMEILKRMQEKNPDFNALHKQNNPDWKRKKSLPYHFDDEYAPVANYSEFHGE